MSITSYIKTRISFSFILLLTYSYAISQENNEVAADPTPDTIMYYSDYSDLLAFRLYTNTKWNTLDIIKNDNILKLRPNGPTALGVGFNYRSYGLGIALGIPKSSTSNEKYGKTNRFDLQVNAYGKKIGIDGFIQFYKGYYLANPYDYVDWTEEKYPQIPDMRIYSIGLNAFYIFNSKKFSYKAAFVRNQIQRKSAGSLTTGIFGQMDLALTDQGFFPPEIPDSLRHNFDLKSFKTLAIGITIGYLYTWVISKKFFINFGVNPGFGLQTINLETVEGVKFTKYAPAGQIAARSAIGFDSKYFYAGISATVIWRNFKYKGYDLDLATEQLRFFIGKRFNVSGKNKVRK